MLKRITTPARSKAARPHHMPAVKMSAIRRFAGQVVKRFRPDKVILFGSRAYGRPHETSDVDILVVMPTANEIDQSIRIWKAIDAPFPLDLIVRTPENLHWRLEEGDWFLQEVVSKGKVLYEKTNRAMGAQSRGRSVPRQDGHRR